LKLALLFILSISTTYGGYYIEPYAGWGLGESEKRPYFSFPERIQWRSLTTSGGTRFGYQRDNNIFYALDLERGKVRHSKKSNNGPDDVDFEQYFLTYAVDLGYQVPSIPLRLTMRWFVSIESNDEIDFGPGKGMGFMMSYTGWNALWLNFEFKSYSFNEADGVDYNDDERYRFTDFHISISHAFEL
jgi:hypothetical protein